MSIREGTRAVVTDRNCFYRGRQVIVDRRYYIPTNNSEAVVVRLADHEAVSFHLHSDGIAAL